jgi:UDP-N-acetylmuramoyl-tripeptide--D-alanyl-D-alanine ligase
LGASSAELHRAAGRFAARTGRIDWIIGVAGHAEDLVAGAIDAGLPAAQTKFFATSDEAAEFVRGLIAPGDVVLVKGSRGVKMERIVEALIARHAEPSGTPGTAPDAEVRH